MGDEYFSHDVYCIITILNKGTTVSLNISLVIYFVLSKLT